MDLSYAQNLEDYHLWRAFEGKPRGVYVDVGAGHPVADNVSCWFYLQGWRGLIVEPQPELARLYAHVRPRDAVFCGLAGRAPGQATFHVADRLHGFSTMDPAAARALAEGGVGFREVTAPVATLTELCERHGFADIDFLKIDVEGAEGEVLAGLDLARLRPKVMCLEAVAPGSMAPNWSGWEPALLAADYAFALDDGLNRFYVAREQAALAARFPREKADWMIAPHLGHTNSAPWREDHPDHAFARRLTGAVLAALPALDRSLLLAWVTHGEREADLDGPADAAARARALDRLFPEDGRFPHARKGLERIEAASLRAFYAAVLDSDAFRVLTGRLAMSYDGGQILD
ncbi:MAG TPA: FkbM family methyltransferase [Beijerinckiaceae bacterium]|jgi:FkbM family methyltransferase